MCLRVMDDLILTNSEPVIYSDLEESVSNTAVLMMGNSGPTHSPVLCLLAGVQHAARPAPAHLVFCSISELGK